MRDGRIEQTGTPEELYSRPRTRFVAAFIGGANILAGVGRGDCVMTPIGRVPIDREATGDVTVALRPEHLELAPQAAGLLAISLGLSHNFQDDHDQLAQGMIVYDALYAWARHVRGERHTWNPQQGPRPVPA